MFSYDEFLNKLESCDMEGAGQQLKNIPGEQHSDIILRAGYDMDSIAVYTFTCYLIQCEGAFYHDTAISLLIHVYSHIEGAYSAALCHLRQRYENDPDNTGYLEMLLFFHDIPEKLVSDGEALTAAKKIICRDKDNPAALRIIANCGS